jgi:hypothetical protein
LYKKIFLEAFQAKKLIFTFLEKGPFKTLISKDSCYLRMFITTSRSFKDKIIKNPSIRDIQIKKYYVDLAFPRFLWVVELTDKQLFKKKKAFGLVIIDATETNTANFNGILHASYKQFFYDISEEELFEDQLFNIKFDIFENNLTPYIN